MYYIRSKLKVEVDIRCANQSKRKEDCMLDIVQYSWIAKDDHYFMEFALETRSKCETRGVCRATCWGKNNNEDFGLRRTQDTQRLKSEKVGL